ncbi:hypothetical protein [Sorangium sp. So ce1182]|uniref:hypothetical protein n=1 Tax=Sorangium sp. So ce1182 TaxID=3133334 RepID=UPI003F61ACAF
MESADSDTFPLGDSAGDKFPTTCSGFTGDRRTASAVAQKEAYLPHIAEGIDDVAHAELVCQSGDQPEYDLFAPQTAVVHGVAVSASDVQRCKDKNTMLVWSPRSNIDLYGNTAPIALYANLGVPIAAGAGAVKTAGAAEAAPAGRAEATRSGRAQPVAANPRTRASGISGPAVRREGRAGGRSVRRALVMRARRILPAASQHAQHLLTHEAGACASRGLRSSLPSSRW